MTELPWFFMSGTCDDGGICMIPCLPTCAPEDVPTLRMGITALPEKMYGRNNTLNVHVLFSGYYGPGKHGFGGAVRRGKRMPFGFTGLSGCQGARRFGRTEQ